MSYSALLYRRTLAARHARLLPALPAFRRRFALAGRTVLVTGGARGIGLELSNQLIARGAKVLAIGRDPATLAALEAAHPGRVSSLEADLADPDIPRGVANWVSSEHPDCSVLINNAAVMFYPDLSAGSVALDAIATEIDINLTAPLQLATAMLPLLARHRSAAIVNVTSGLAIAPKPSAPVYCATKAGLASFTRTLRYQCEDAGLPIQVSEAVMTLVDTTLSRGDPATKLSPARAAAELLAGLEAGKREIWIEKTRLLRLVWRLSPALACRLLRNG